MTDKASGDGALDARQPEASSETYTLVQNTARRLAAFATSITFVTGSSYEMPLRHQIDALALPNPCRVVSEPEARNSMAAIGLGAAWVEKEYGPSLAGSFAADHHLGNTEAFYQAVRTALDAAMTGRLVTIGITPTAPVTGYGYIEIDWETPGNPGWHLVKQFKEKPDAAVAKTYLATGNYLWNAGMFVFHTEVLFDALERESPGSPEILRELVARWEILQRKEKLAAWRQLVHAPIDTVLAEPMSRRGEVAVVPAAENIDWSDIGDWQAVYELHKNAVKTGATGRGLSLSGSRFNGVDVSGLDADRPLVNLSTQTPTYVENCPGALVDAPDLKGVAIVGIPEAVVVESNGRLLVTTKQYAQQVKAASRAADQWEGV